MVFSRLYRLSKKTDFNFVFAKPQKLTFKSLTVLYRCNQKTYPRLGILISKPLINRAIDRNRTRRVIRESFRKHKEFLKGLDIVILLRSKCSPQPRQTIEALRDDIDDLWQILSRASLKTA